MVVSVPVPVKLWSVHALCPGSQYCTSYPVIAGMPAVSGAIQLTSSAVVGLPSLVETDKSMGTLGGSLRSVTFTVSVRGVELSVPSLAVTSTSRLLSPPASDGFS